MSKVDTVLTSLMSRLNVSAPLEEFKMGIEIEREHTKEGPKEGKYAVIPMNLLSLAKIAAAHLAELPDYYSRLKKMEDSVKPKTASDHPIRNTFFNLLGLNEMNKLLDKFDEKNPKNLKTPKKPDTPPPPVKTPEPEEIDDDFFASSMTSEEIWGDKEEALRPDDVIMQPKANTAAKTKEIPFGVAQLAKLQEQLRESLSFIHNKLIPESKKDNEHFRTLKEVQESVENSLLVVESAVQILKR